jgi:hypothetical protein
MIAIWAEIQGRERWSDGFNEACARSWRRRWLPVTPYTAWTSRVVGSNTAQTAVR